MRARGLRNYRLKYSWRKVFCCICQPNKDEREIQHKTGLEPKIWGCHGLPRLPLRTANAPLHPWF